MKLDTVILITVITLQLLSCNNGKKYVLDAGIEREYVETIDGQLKEKNSHASNVCNIDNTIYIPGKEFIYKVLHTKKQDTFKISFEHGGWRFYNIQKPDCLNTIGIEIVEGNIAGMTQCKFNYYQNRKVTDDFEYTGIIENKKNIWLHPPRSRYFRILELSPFPYIKFPDKTGKSWTWELEIGEYWGSRDWIEWEGNITNKYVYKVIDKNKVISEAFGELEAVTIKATAKSRIGQTELTSIFNEQYGFLKLVYTNINDTGLIFELTEVREKSDSE